METVVRLPQIARQNSKIIKIVNLRADQYSTQAAL